MMDINRLNRLLVAIEAWWRRLLSSALQQDEKVSDLHRLPQWRGWAGPIITRGDKVAQLFTDKEGTVYEVVEPGARGDPFTVLLRREHSYEAMFYYFSQALAALKEGDYERVESGLIQARGKAVDAHHFQIEDKAQ
jgi:hypothetical protein